LADGRGRAATAGRADARLGVPALVAGQVPVQRVPGDDAVLRRGGRRRPAAAALARPLEPLADVPVPPPGLAPARRGGLAPGHAVGRRGLRCRAGLPALLAPSGAAPAPPLPHPPAD